MTTTSLSFLTSLLVSCSVLKVAGGLLILVVCAINMYFVVTYATALDSVWLYVMSAFLSVAYLVFVGYLVGNSSQLYT